MTTRPKPKALRLSGALKTLEAPSLLADLKARQGDALVIDAAEVTFLGGACLQALVAAAETWRAADERFEIVNPSKAWMADIATLGAETLLGGSEETPQ